jgi:hypothetical protein
MLTSKVFNKKPEEQENAVLRDDSSFYRGATQIDLVEVRFLRTVIRRALLRAHAPSIATDAKVSARSFALVSPFPNPVRVAIPPPATLCAVLKSKVLFLFIGLFQIFYMIALFQWLVKYFNPKKRVFLNYFTISI